LNLRFTICDLRLAAPCAPWLLVAAFWLSAPTVPAQTTPSDEIPPLAPPLPEMPPTAWEQHGWLLWIAIPLALLLIAAVVWLALRPGKPPVLPAPTALAKTTLLALQSQPEDGATLSQISQALRRYLIASFWLPPHEMTTQDFCARLAAHDQIGPELAPAIAEFLRACDERKFAPNTAQPPLHAASRAMELVDMAEAMRMASASRFVSTTSPTSA
jgi:hypothetical protein